MNKDLIKKFVPIGYAISYEDEEVLVLTDASDGKMCLVFDKYTIEMKWSNPGTLSLREMEKLIEILKILKEEQKDAEL